MEYIFGTTKKDGVDVDNVKTIGTEHSNLEGKVSITRKYSDSYITDNFRVLEKYRSDEDPAGNCYDWYVIQDHSQYEDKFSPGIIATEQEITDHELAIMEAEQEITDLDLRLMELEINV